MTEQASPTQAAEPQTKRGQFAVINAAELLERLAYYGIVSINVLYLASLGYSFKDIGFLAALMLALPYVVPVLTGAVAERVGYKPTMLVAFVLYASGFLVLASVTTLPLLATGAILLAVGAGMFKPLAVATVAHVTSTKDRAMGYNLYYMGVNIGGFVGPVLVALIGKQYQLAFLVGACIMALDFLLIALLFRNPTPPQRGKSLGASLAPLGQVFLDVRFMALVVIFSGFWFLYAMNFTFLTTYLDAYVPHPSWFDPNMQQAIDPLFVIIFGIPLGRIAQRRGAVVMMALGILLSVAGFVLLGFVATFWALVAGIIISTAGEVLAYPGFLNYVSRIAPKDRVAVYQGVGFLPLFIGFFLGPLVGGFAYQGLAVETGQPPLFWAVMCSVGIASAAGFLAYARWVKPPAVQPGPAQAKPGSAPAAATARATPRRSWATGVPGILGTAALIPILVLAAAATDQKVSEAPPVETEAVTLLDLGGTTQEGTHTPVAVGIGPAVVGNLTFRLTWTDEPATTAIATQQPDTFRLVVKDPTGKTVKEGQGASQGSTPGSIVVVVPATGMQGNATVEIHLDDAGDEVIVGQTLNPDTGNAWHLTVAATALKAPPSAGAMS